MAGASSILLSLKNVYETLFVSVPTVVDAVRGAVSRRECDARLESWATNVIRNLEMIVTVHGREHMDPGQAYVVMSNHQSHYDIAVLYYVLGGNMRMVAKQELFGLPIFGRAIKDAGFIAVDRKDRARAIQSLEGAKSYVLEGTHLWIAPEGTRSPTGELMPFKKGGFMIAMATGAPILPVTIRGTRDALRAKGLRSRSNVEVMVTIHPPIDVAGIEPDAKPARDELIARVRHSIASAL